VISKLSASIFKVIEDPILGKFNLTIAILIPLAFTGELIYRSSYFFRNLGEFFPTLGWQFGIESLLRFSFEIPKSFIQIWNIFCFVFPFSEVFT